MAFTEQASGQLITMASSQLSIPHAFTTRLGGVSQGIYSSLNLGLYDEDDPSAVRQNYIRLGSALGFDPDALVRSCQVHGDTVLRVTSRDCRPLDKRVPYEADGLITDEPGVPLMIYSADCVPILLYDPVRGAIGAVHAGWRGTCLDIVGKAVKQMTAAYGSAPENLRAAIGPCISGCCFETRDDVKDAVTELLGSEAPLFIEPRADKFLIDLKGVNARLLRRAGVLSEHIDVSDECTSCRHDKYWSHRFTTGRRGNQAAVILMKGTCQ